MFKEVKKVAAIHDISGFGRCSLTAVIPILSALGVQPCPFPTALLSCQTGYEKFSFLDLTDAMSKIKRNWDEMGFAFDGVYSGFLGSEEQINIVYNFINERKPFFVLIDPVMGDNGKIYKTYTRKMCEKMVELVKCADIVTPNLTEACILTGRDFIRENVTNDILMDIAGAISELGPSKVIITGIIKDGLVYNFSYDKVINNSFMVSSEFNGESYSGTGDVFASILCGMLIQGYDFKYSVEKASKFINDTIRYTANFDGDSRNGILLEPMLKELFIYDGYNKGN